MDINTFSQLGLTDGMLKAVHDCGYTQPTPIQSESIPVILQGKDVIGRSNTGTGKTAAFAIPSIEHISTSQKCVQVLVLCPTRELAMQSYDEYMKFAKYKKGLKAVCIYGGAPFTNQINALKRGVHVVIGTPGRIMDHMRRRTLSVKDVSMVILDEADEMLNMGFREDIETILSSIENEHQTILFSATMPKEILDITDRYQKSPELIEIKSKNKTVDKIEQYYYNLPMGKKVDALFLLLSYYSPERCMIFCNTKAMTDILAENLVKHGFKALALHGDLKQSQRTTVMDSFKSGRSNILIATDVAARGIDVENIDCVINFDIPQNTEYYIHRIGRTGRAGKDGTAFTLLCGKTQEDMLLNIMSATKSKILPGVIPSPEQIYSHKVNRSLDKLKDELKIEKESDEFFLTEIEKLISEGYDLKHIASVLLKKYVGVKKLKISAVTTKKLAERQNKFVKISLSIGRKNKVTPNFILGSLSERAGVNSREVGKIDILDRHSVIEVSEQHKNRVLNKMNGCKILGVRIKAEIVKGKHSASKSNNQDKNYSDKNSRHRRYSKHSNRRQH